jgi:putative phosphoesterase
MRFGLIADTHIPEAGPDIWPQVYARFRQERLDAILHGGDIHVLDVLDRLEERVGVPVYACRGNGDDGGGGRPICPEDPRLREAWILDRAGFRIGLCHDMALPEHPPHRTIDTMMQRYFGGPCNIVVHGDTHIAEIITIRNTLLVNPGSPMYPRNMNTSLGNIGFLVLSDDTAEAWVEPLHPSDGPTLQDGGVLDHRQAAERFPEQWVLFAVHGHDPIRGLSYGAVLTANFDPEEIPALERGVRRRDPSAVLIAFHTGALPEHGAAQRLSLPVR